MNPEVHVEKDVFNMSKPPKHYVVYIVSGMPWYYRLWNLLSNPIRFVVFGHWYIR